MTKNQREKNENKKTDFINISLLKVKKNPIYSEIHAKSYVLIPLVVLYLNQHLLEFFHVMHFDSLLRL